jgi:hypothetical protein
MTRETGAQGMYAQEEPWQAFFSTNGANGLNDWTTEQLLSEVVSRSSGDAPALRMAQATGLRALLAALDN